MFCPAYNFIVSSKNNIFDRELSHRCNSDYINRTYFCIISVKFHQGMVHFSVMFLLFYTWDIVSIFSLNIL